MNEIFVTLHGNVTHEPNTYQLTDGSRVTVIRVAAAQLLLDKQTQEWRNGPTSYLSVRCYRGLADNVAQSIHRGQPVVVHGRLKMRESEREGERRLVVEIEAVSVGHDLKWGIAAFQKPGESWGGEEQTAA